MINQNKMLHENESNNAQCKIVNNRDKIKTIYRYI